MRPSVLIGILAHLLLAGAIIAVLVGHYRGREAEVAAIREDAAAERRQTEALQREVDVQQQTLHGLVDGDPFAVDLMARERLGHQQSGEIQPPPLVDNAQTSPNK